MPSTLDPRVLEHASTTGWNSYFPFLTDAEISECQKRSTGEEKAQIEEWLGIEKIINQQQNREHVLATSLFWKNTDHWTPDLPTPTLDLLRNARSYGLVTRFDPWSHYVQPLISGAESLARRHPELTLRIYLAKDLEFLVPLFPQSCEIFLMRHSSIRHNPGALWRFLALEDAPGAVSIIDADMVEREVDWVTRCTDTLPGDLASWRLPTSNEVDASNFVVYRPMTACAFGTRLRFPVRTLMSTFIWLFRQGAFPRTIKYPDRGELRHFQHPWPGYGTDEWFLTTAIYPRMLPHGLRTRADHRRNSPLFATDVALANAVNSNSRAEAPSK